MTFLLKLSHYLTSHNLKLRKKVKDGETYLQRLEVSQLRKAVHLLYLQMIKEKNKNNKLKQNTSLVKTCLVLLRTGYYLKEPLVLS